MPQLQLFWSTEGHSGVSTGLSLHHDRGRHHSSPFHWLLLLLMWCLQRKD